MNAKELKIEAPEGYEVDWDNSSMNTIRFKPVKKKITYQDVKEKLFQDGKEHYVEYSGTISSSKTTRYYGENIIIATSIQQIQQLLALNKLMNVAKQLNGNWKINWRSKQEKYYIVYDYWNYVLKVTSANCCRSTLVYFESPSLAKQAIEILGEDEVKKALGIFD